MGLSAASTANVGLGLQAFGAGASAFGSYNTATAQKSVLNYESSVATNNATLANYQANVAQQVGDQQLNNSELRTAQLFGAQRATMAANGVDLGSGSANEVLASTKYMGERDALTIQNNTANQVWGYKTQGQNYTSEAAADTATANAINPRYAAAASLLSGAGTVASNWYRSKQVAGN